MAPLRSARNRPLPPGLRERGGYYSWINPVDGREHGLGRNRRQAIAEAVEANVHVLGLANQVRLVDRLTGNDERTVGAWLDRYATQLADRKLAKNTRRTRKSQAKIARVLLGEDTLIERVSTLTIAEAIRKIKAEGKARSAQAMRSFLQDAFRAAVAAGWVSSNPVLVTEKIRVEVQRARLTLNVYRAVHEKAGTWLRNAMDLALVTAQRREDVAVARFADFRDEAWYCEQGKTGNRVCIPYALRLNAIGLSLGDVVKRCRATGVLSKHLIHQVRPYGNSPPGNPIWLDTITRKFSDALAKVDLAALGVTFGDKKPPTFHEIRSLAERLYAEQGNVDTQELLGHRDPRMTRIYHDARGAEWVRVKVG